MKSENKELIKILSTTIVRSIKVLSLPMPSLEISVKLRQKEIAKIEIYNSEHKLKASSHRDNKSSKNNNSEPWASRWIAVPVGYLFSKEQREEWLGDLQEIIHEMHCESYPGWIINVICIGKTIILIVSALRIKITDFFPLGQKNE